MKLTRTISEDVGPLGEYGRQSCRLYFQYNGGGMYIDVGLEGHGAVEVINLENRDRPENLPALRGVVDEWINTCKEEDRGLVREVLENWIYY